MTSKLRVFIYGRDQDRLDHVEESFREYNTIKIPIENDKSLNKAIEIYSPINSVFINADTMKKVNIIGTESMSSVIDKIDRQAANRKIPYIIAFNRYQDSGYQTQYVKEIFEGVSLFKSYNPTNSDCFYVTGTVLEEVKKNYIGSDYYATIFSLVRQGKFECFSFNPNLYTYRIESSDQDYTTQQSKTSIMKSESNFSINDSVGRFFNSHLLLFWLFFVFFTCTVFVIVIRVFKIGKFLV